MSNAPTEIKECTQCGPRLRSQFRTRPGGRLNSRCRRCTKLNARHEAWLTARADAAMQTSQDTTPPQWSRGVHAPMA